MKKLLLILALFASFNAGAQMLINEPADLNMSAEEFAAIYGTVAEFNFQESRKYESAHKHLVLFVGGKAIWVKELAEYLGESSACGNQVEVSSGAGWVQYDVSCGFKPGHEVAIKAYYDAAERTTKVVIKGHANELASLFVSYWYRPDLQLTEKNVIQESASDKIAYSATGTKATITITKSENIDIFTALR
jgi:hypothetical protein